MIQYLSENLWLLWTIITMICLILELSSGDFFVTCFAIGALFAVVSTLLGIPFWAQVLVFAVFSVLSIFFVRPSLVRHLHGKAKERPSNADALIGKVGVVIEKIELGSSGYIRIDGDEWKAVARGADSIDKGEKVRVVSRDSIIMTVEKL
ncbi:NfeD family protein [Prevotella sp. KH2C16]|uniref:NfeD family protein n=1 Tax=Prevotella sp. KH2C16 TaxID=1855325 RepID=UPI0008E022A5|nr:NfeD family protein [Prevotella sp. KH2C16]SFF92382.1 Membrane protein implicated in regulation of membrane protease activity [Prevotella sp. KH2C16]